MKTTIFTLIISVLLVACKSETNITGVYKVALKNVTNENYEFSKKVIGFCKEGKLLNSKSLQNEFSFTTNEDQIEITSTTIDKQESKAILKITKQKADSVWCEVISNEIGEQLSGVPDFRLGSNNSTTTRFVYSLPFYKNDKVKLIKFNTTKTKCSDFKAQQNDFKNEGNNYLALYNGLSITYQEYQSEKRAFHKNANLIYRKSFDTLLECYKKFVTYIDEKSAGLNKSNSNPDINFVFEPYYCELQSDKAVLLRIINDFENLKTDYPNFINYETEFNGRLFLFYVNFINAK
ncbi:MAG: hypothetical protein ABIP35_03670 [Ginsengibacter sp.]